MSWNIEKLKSKNLNWFKLVYKDFAQRGKKPELTDDEMKSLYYKLIGKEEPKGFPTAKEFRKENDKRQVKTKKGDKI